MINSLQLGGAERVVQTIVNNLCVRHDVYLITLEGNLMFDLDDRVIVHNLSSGGTNKNKLIKVFLLVPLALRLNKYLKANDISVVQSNLFRANYVNILAGLFGGAHYVSIADHTLPERLYKEGVSGKINLFLIRALYKYAGVSVSVSKKVQSQLLSITELPEKKYVVNNPFDLDYILSSSKDVVDDFEFIEGNVYLVAVGRINSIKRYDLIIKALNLLNNNKLCLIVIGGEENVNVSDLLSLAVNKNNIYFLGEKKNPYKYIKNSDMLILSSDSESFGNVLVESMICGTPVISTRCGGPEEIIKNNYNGTLVDVGDAGQLADAISKLFLNRELMTSQAYNASFNVGAYGVRKIVGQYEAILGNCN